MYWLIPKINPYVGKLTKIPNNETISNDFDEVDLNANKRNSTIVLKFEEKQLSKSIQRDSSYINFEKMISEKNIDLDEFNKQQTFELSLNEEKKRKCYKKLAKSLDILFIILTIISCVLAFIESQKFYSLNKPYVLCGQILLRAIQSNRTVNDWESIFSFHNLKEMLKGKGKLDEVNESLPLYDNTDFLLKYDITPDNYNYYLGKSTLYNIKIPIILNSTINHIRWSILLLSNLSIVISLCSYYSCYLFKKVYYYNNYPFYKTELFIYSLCEFLILIIFPYPELKSYSYQCSHQECTIYPSSIFLSMFCFFRIFFLLKLMKFSQWNNDNMIRKCNSYGIKHTLGFVIKCFFTYHPKKVLLLLLITVIFSFGLSIRLIEMYYWVGTLYCHQNWENVFNALSFILLTLISNGLGDFYPRSTVGKALTAFVTIIGVEVISTIMIIFSSLSSFSFKEEQINKLLTRTQIKSNLKNYYSNIIHKYLNYFLRKRKDRKYTKRELYHFIKEEIKIVNEAKIESRLFDFIPTKEMCLDIIESFDANLTRISNSIIVIQTINTHLEKFIEKQHNNIKRLQQDVLSLKRLYYLIDNCKESFGRLVNYDRDVLVEELGNNYYSIKKSIQMYMDKLNNDEVIGKKKTNPNQFALCKYNGDCKDIMKNKIYEDLKKYKYELKDYKVSTEEYNKHFANVFLEPDVQYLYYDKGKLKWNSSKALFYNRKSVTEIFK